MGMRFCLLIGILFGPAAPAQTVEFARDIAPLFARCFGCHGAQQQVDGLRLDVREAALQGGNSGALVQPGKSANSRLMHYLTGQKSALNPKGTRMPMGAPPFEAKELATIAAWIDGGAQWPITAPAVSRQNGPLPWSFQPIRRPAVPALQDRSRARNPIDNFVLAS